MEEYIYATDKIFTRSEVEKHTADRISTRSTISLIAMAIAALILYPALSTGGDLIDDMVHSPILFLFLAIVVIGAMTGMITANSKYCFSYMYIVNYICLMGLWFAILSTEEWGTEREMITLRLISIPIGMVIMGIIGIVITGLSQLLADSLKYVFQWKGMKFICIMIFGLAVCIGIWWLVSQNGIGQLLAMLSKWNSSIR